ncbi:hypothetical protein CC78DRAFT_536284 [Lojkania enalia]|uniref:Uncharacterized protein n=1 Tax=Lojkania enalia TaxID=147567 RepID=A0A9P4K0H4_9PLEO|nr:hypothetical protein CC78DRAFT_536284 [Didymosphaeria enalia]
MTTPSKSQSNSLYTSTTRHHPQTLHRTNSKTPATPPVQCCAPLTTVAQLTKTILSYPPHLISNMPPQHPHRHIAQSLYIHETTSAGTCRNKTKQNQTHKVKRINRTYSIAGSGLFI